MVDAIDYAAAVRRMKSKKKVDYETAAKDMWDNVKQRDRNQPREARIFTTYCPKCGGVLAGEKCSKCGFLIS